MDRCTVRGPAPGQGTSSHPAQPSALLSSSGPSSPSRVPGPPPQRPDPDSQASARFHLPTARSPDSGSLKTVRCRPLPDGPLELWRPTRALLEPKPRPHGWPRPASSPAPLYLTDPPRWPRPLGLHLWSEQVSTDLPRPWARAKLLFVEQVPGDLPALSLFPYSEWRPGKRSQKP